MLWIFDRGDGVLKVKFKNIGVDGYCMFVLINLLGFLIDCWFGDFVICLLFDIF